MKKKKIMILGISLLLGIGIIIFISLSINKNNKIINNNMDIINSNYKELAVNIKKYNDIRDNYLLLINDFRYDDYVNKHDEYTLILNNYNNIIDEIDKNIEYINGKCDRLYKDVSVNEICNNYKIIYEKLINIYVDDISNYNDKIKGYNEYMNGNISLNKSKYTDYIDYNKDNKYEGIDKNEK